MLNDLVTIVVLALAVSAISHTITRAKVFEPTRTWVKSRSKWFGLLVECSYCVSVWLAFGLVLTYQPRPVESWLPLDLFVSVFTIVALAAMFLGLIRKAFPGALAQSPLPPPPK